MMCNKVQVVSCFVLLMTAAGNPTWPAPELISSSASIIERNVKQVISNNKDKNPQNPDEFIDYWTNIFIRSKKALLKDLVAKQFTDDIIYRMAMIIGRREYLMYEDVLKDIAIIVDKRYHFIGKHNCFYDEVIDKINKARIEENFFSKHKSLYKSVERLIFIDFLVSLVEKCHINNSLVQIFTRYPDLIRRNIERYRYKKDTVFVFKTIVDNFVNDKEVAEENQDTLQEFVDKIYEVLPSMRSDYDVLIGFDKEFVGEYEKVLDSSPTNDGNELTIESLIKNKTFIAMFPDKFFDYITENLKEYTDMKLFLKELSKCRMEEYFGVCRDIANSTFYTVTKYRGDAEKFRVDIKDEPLLMYKLEDICTDAIKLLLTKSTCKALVHVKVHKKLLDSDIENFRYFIGMELEGSVSELCPISESVMTRPVSFEGVQKHYDLTSIMLYLIRFVSERYMVTYEIFELFSNKVVDIRNFQIIEGRSQAIETFNRRAGSFRKHIEVYKFHNSLNANQTLFKEIINTILTKFSSISQELRNRIRIKMNEVEGWNSDQNVHVNDGNNEDWGLETDVTNSDGEQQNHNFECDALKYKESKIISIAKSTLSDAEKTKEAWDEHVNEVRQDIQDYRRQLSLKRN